MGWLPEETIESCAFQSRGGTEMRVYLEKNVARQSLSDVQCNVCGRSVNKDNSGYFEDHVSISKAWGYHSPYDGEMHGIDVCVDCYQGWLTDFEIPPKMSCYCHMMDDGQCVCLH